MKVTKKLWAWLLCLTMISAFIPANITFAANDPQWTYKVYLTATNDNEAGTGNQLYVEIFHSEGKLYQELGGVNTGKSTSTKYITTDVAPWQLTGMTVTNPGSNAVCISSVYLGVKATNNPTNDDYISLGTFSGNSTWIETQNKSKHEKSKSWTMGSLRSKVDGGIYSLASGLNGTTVLDVTQSQISIDCSVTWDGKIKDQYMPSYNIFEYGSYPTVKVSVDAKGAPKSQDGSAYSTYSASQLGIETFLGRADNSKKAGFSITSKADLLNKMNTYEINCITVTTEITLPAARTTSNYSTDCTISRTYKFVRNVFDIGTPTFSTNYSNPNITDYYYYNIDNEQTNNGITVTVPITYGSGNYSHLNDRALSLFSICYVNATFNAKLKVGNTDTYIYCDSSSARTSTSGGVLSLYFPLDGEYSSGVHGLTLILTDLNLESKISTGSPSYMNFYLHQTGKPLTGSDTTYTLGNTSYYSGENKLDTIRPTVEYTVADGSAGKLGEWSKSLTLSSQASENMYLLDDTKFTSPVYKYSLVSGTGDNKTAVKIYDKNGITGANTIQQASASGSLASTIVLALAEKTEGEYTLEVYGKDMANNETTQTLENIYLDNKAPTFSVKESQTVDVTNTLTKRYNFSISDLSGTGRVYYYIDTEGIGVTDAYFNFDKSDAETGTTETKNKWAFIPQDADKQSGDTDGAVIIQVENGGSFDGLLYYFAQDDFGNTSGVSTKRISLVNTDLTCTAEDTEIGTYNHYLITLQTPNASGADIYYQWYDSDGTAVTDETKYTGTIDTREISGIEDWDGEYTLKCTAKTETSSRETEFSYTFDHTAPTLSVTDTTAGSYAEEHVINITSSDGIGVAELTGQYYRADGTAEGDPFTISSYTDSFSYSVSENLIFAPEKSGAYRLKVTSSDLNGRSAEQTTGLIYIRNAAPEVTLTAETASEYGEYPLVGADGGYSVKVNVNEDFINASNTAVTTTEGQYLYYRIVNDGIAGEWTKLSNPLTASEETTENEDGTTSTSSAFTGEYTIDAPAELIEGENIVAMEFIIAAEGRTGIYADEAVASSDSSDGIEKESYRIAHEYFTIFRDTTAPEYVLTLEDERTADDIIGKLTVTDTYTDEFTVTPLDSAVTLELIGEADEEAEDEDTTLNEDADIELEDELLEYTNYTVTVSDNVTTSITVTDAAGNSVSVLIEIKKIDREGPTAELTSYEKDIAVGDRLDASAVITMSDKRMDLDTFELAVIPADELESAVDEDGNISDDYFGDYASTMTYTKTSESVAAN
ncbi:MAG: hypothetical protein LIO59_06345, partial [Oscillospiraceae bacterium]|nr:hypothetical protein [Oscillospiraceae bacterium]